MNPRRSAGEGDSELKSRRMLGLLSSWCNQEVSWIMTGRGRALLKVILLVANEDRMRAKRSCGLMTISSTTIYEKVTSLKKVHSSWPQRGRKLEFSDQNSSLITNLVVGKSLMVYANILTCFWACSSDHIILMFLVLELRALLAMKCSNRGVNFIMAIEVQGLARSVRLRIRSLRSKACSSFILTYLIYYQSAFMHCYPLPLLPPPLSLADDSPPPCFSMTHRWFIHSRLASPHSICIDMTDLFQGRRSRLEVRTNVGDIQQVLLCEEKLILKTKDNLLGEVEVEKMVGEDQKTVFFLEKQHFSYLSPMLTQNGQVDKLQALLLGSNAMVSYITGEYLIFQELTASHVSALKIHLLDLGSTGSLHQCILCQHLQTDPADQLTLVVALITIRQESGEFLFGILNIEWESQRYQFFPLTFLRQDCVGEKSAICSAAEDTLMFSIGKSIIICRKIKSKWVTLCSLFLEDQIEGLASQSTLAEPFRQTLIVSTLHNTQRILYYYDIKDLLLTCALNPVRVTSYQKLSGAFHGFCQVSNQLLLLLLSDGTYLLGTVILKLTKIITGCKFAGEREQEKQTEDGFLDCSEEQQQPERIIQCLPFGSFSQYVHKKTSSIQKCLEELFSFSRLQHASTSFANHYFGALPCLVQDWWFFTKPFLRELSLITLYLSNFINFLIAADSSSPSANVPQDYNQLLQDVGKIQLVDVPLVGESKIIQTIKKSVANLRDNVLAMSALFDNVQDKEFKYFYLFDCFKFSELLRYFIDHSALADRISFMAYAAAKEGNALLWRKSRQLLTAFLQLRRDYHPLIGYLCGNMPVYTLNSYYLRHCEYLHQKEQLELEELPSLGEVYYAATKYLKDMGLPYLSSFVPEQMHTKKYDSEVLFLTVPEEDTATVESTWKEYLIQEGPSLYLKLTGPQVASAVEKMEDSFIAEVYGHSISEDCELGQKLKVVNQIFVLQLRVQDSLNQENSLINRQKIFDCVCYPNEVYELWIRPLILVESERSVKLVKGNPSSSMEAIGEMVMGTRKGGMQKESQNFTQIAVGERYLGRLSGIFRQFRVDLGNFLPEAEECETSSWRQNIQDFMNISLIELQQSNLKQSFPSSPFRSRVQGRQYLNKLRIIWHELWRLHAELTQISSKEFEVQEYLHRSYVVKAVLDILTIIHSKMKGDKELLLSLQTSSLNRADPLKKIRKMMALGKRISVVNKSQSDFSEEEAQLLLNVLKLSLIRQLFKRTGEWLLDLDDLMAEAARLDLRLSENQLITFNFLLDIVIF